jgi:hypothetical protein
MADPQSTLKQALRQTALADFAGRIIAGVARVARRVPY